MLIFVYSYTWVIWLVGGSLHFVDFSVKFDKYITYIIILVIDKNNR